MLQSYSSFHYSFSLDTTPPKFDISCPQTIRLTLSKSESTVYLDWPGVNATDNSGDVILVTVTPNITFPVVLGVGTTRLLYQAKDRQGNTNDCPVNFIVAGML